MRGWVLRSWLESLLHCIILFTIIAFWFLHILELDHLLDCHPLEEYYCIRSIFAAAGTIMNIKLIKKHMID